MHWLPLAGMFLLLAGGPARAQDVRSCRGYAGPGGPCFDGPGGPAHGARAALPMRDQVAPVIAGQAVPATMVQEVQLTPVRVVRVTTVPADRVFEGRAARLTQDQAGPATAGLGALLRGPRRGRELPGSVLLVSGLDLLVGMSYNL